MSKTKTSPLTEAIATLRAYGIAYQQPSSKRLKVGVLNFNPYTGSIRVDGYHTTREKGLATFIQYIRVPYHHNVQWSYVKEPVSSAEMKAKNTVNAGPSKTYTDIKESSNWVSTRLH